MLLSPPAAGSAAAAAVWTLERMSRSGRELRLQPEFSMLPVCTREVGGMLFCFLPLISSFLGNAAAGCSFLDAMA